MRLNIISICFVLGIFALIGCQKDAGEGGNSSITGKVYAFNYSNGWLVSQFYAPEERVYIMYGNSTIYNDDMRTHYDGSYRFDYLYPGTYTIFCYSDCDTCASKTQAIKQTIEITEKNQIVELPDFQIRK